MRCISRDIMGGIATKKVTVATTYRSRQDSYLAVESWQDGRSEEKGPGGSLNNDTHPNERVKYIHILNNSIGEYNEVH